MYHSIWKNSHYEAGLRYGKSLFKKGINPISARSITKLQKEFSAACLPFYIKYYPEITEEIQGIADGLNIDFSSIADFLFTMYCFTYENNCSCFAFSKGNKTILARNSDFLSNIRKLCDSAYYNLKDGYRFIGNTTSWTEIEDGINIHGLAAGLTFIYPVKIKPGINAGLMVRYILEKCKNVNEAVAAAKSFPISSQHTIMLADKSGKTALLECCCDKVNVIYPKEKTYLFTTNHFNSPEMLAYQYKGTDDIHSRERYKTIKEALEKEFEPSVKFSADLLSGKYGFMCQYNRKSGMDTIWASVFDVTNLKIYRAEGNPSRKNFIADKRLFKL